MSRLLGVGINVTKSGDIVFADIDMEPWRSDNALTIKTHSLLSGTISPEQAPSIAVVLGTSPTTPGRDRLLSDGTSPTTRGRERLLSDMVGEFKEKPEEPRLAAEE
jgi:hypothetical protein